MGESVPGTKQCRAWCFLGLPLLLTVAAGASASDDVEREFSVAVLPLLEQKCLACHGADAADLKGAFSIRDREHLLLGGESGEPAIVPGDAQQGTLLAAVRWDGLEMPPKENDRLTAEQVAAV